MGYLDSDGLKRFAQNVKNKAMWNWQWTKTAPCVHFWPGEETELEPVVDFLFKEIPPAEGEKGHDNPSTIQGVNAIGLDVTNNMFRLHVTNGTKTQDGVTITIDDDGTITLDGTAEKENAFVEYIHNTTAGKTVFPKGTKLYTKVEIISGTCTYTTGYGFKAQWSAPKTDGRSWYPGWSLKTKDTLWETDCNFHVLSNAVAYYKGTVYSNLKFKVHFQIDHPIERIESQVIQNNTFNLSSTYYGGKVNLKTGEMTVTHHMLTATAFDASDGILDTDYARLRIWPHHTQHLIGSIIPAPMPTSQMQSYERICSELPYGTTDGEGFFTIGAYNSDNQTAPITVYFHKSKLDLSSCVDPSNPTLLEVRSAGTAYISQHPLHFVYKLRNPYTVQLTPQQILSLPRLDHYVPGMNIVYTDQQSIKVGYKRIDNADAQSDEEISGTKTFASSPLVPNPVDLDSQQAAPISFTKDMMRAEIEALTSGRNTIVRDQWGNPHVMVVMPKFMLSAIDPSWPNEPHPAFIVNEVEKSEVFIGKYLASKSSTNRVQTMPGQLPWANITFDNALTACRSLGNGFGMNTNAIWAARALWLWKTMPSDHEYLGNSNYGRTHSNHILTGTPPYAHCIPGDKSTSGRTLTGTGGVLWNDNEEVDGIADLSGNVYEWCSGLRLMNGEIQIISNNDAVMPTMDLSTDSSNWKAILQNGSLVAPNTTDTLKYDGTNPDTTESWSNAGTFNVNTTIVNPNTNGCYRNYFKDTTAISGVTIPNILKMLALYPISSNVQGGSWVCTNGERLALRGGGYATQSLIGPFNLGLDEGIRTYQTLRFGFRTAYIP